MQPIVDAEALIAFCRKVERARYVTVDTEFLRDKTYWPVLCLVQVAGPDDAALIDPLAPGLDISPLFELMRSPATVKVFHSARQDIEIFYRLMGDVPAPLFDTQVAAMVCGFGDAVSYETLAARLADAQIDKSSRFTDWSIRPLTERQLGYALADVTYLRRVYDKLSRLLESNGRTSWLAEEMATLTNPATYRMDPAEAWRRLKPRSDKPRFIAILAELADWRETEAQRRDVPRQRVLKDEVLIDVAARAPRTADELARGRMVPQGIAESRLGSEILAAVERGRHRSPPERTGERPALPPGRQPLVELLRVLLKHQCERHQVAQKLVASAEDIDAIAGDSSDEIPALLGWRRQVFGDAALALRAGRLALSAADGRIHLIDLPAGDRKPA
jgi:ribonuclease D